MNRKPKKDILISEENLNNIISSIEYLLINNLNNLNSDYPGEAGNKRLVRLFFYLLSKIGEPKVFCDIGANDGSTSELAKKQFPEAVVFSLEANPNIYGKNVNRLTRQGIQTLNIAASGETGQVTIYVPKTLSRAYQNGEIVPASITEGPDTGKSSLLKRDEQASYDEYVVQSTTMDLLLEGYRAPEKRDIALWIDVEGAAYEVLSGCEKTLQNTSLIFIETENFQFWKNQKYSSDITTLLIKNGFIPISRDREYEDKQFNIVFIHGSLIRFILDDQFNIQNKYQRINSSKNITHSPRRIRSYSSLASKLASDVPVYIPTFNNPTYTTHMIKQLLSWNINNIFILDNSSSYNDMLSLLDDIEREKIACVIRYANNNGPRFIVEDAQSYQCLPDIFCLTDPDLEFNENLPQDFIYTLVECTNKFKVGKAGLALSLDDREHMKSDKIFIDGKHQFIWEWESRFWRELVGTTPDNCNIYKAITDTTFAVYNKNFFQPNTFFNSVRISGNYSCRHLPWYKESIVPNDEMIFYRKSQKFSWYA